MKILKDKYILNILYWVLMCNPLAATILGQTGCKTNNISDGKGRGIKNHLDPPLASTGDIGGISD